jgi:hypothetical protein
VHLAKSKFDEKADRATLDELLGSINTMQIKTAVVPRTKRMGKK